MCPVPIKSMPGDDQNSTINPSEFCRSFDLSKRLDANLVNRLQYIPIQDSASSVSPFDGIIDSLVASLEKESQARHRVLIPSLLSPALYPSHACEPQHVLNFLQHLRSLLRRYPSQMTVMLSLPLTLFPRETGLVRWIEHLSDGIIHLDPVTLGIANDQSDPVNSHIPSSGKPSNIVEEKPQGFLKIHKLPIITDKGGGSGATNDLAFTLTRKSFKIMPFHLPPVDGDTEAQSVAEPKATQAKDIEF